MSTLNYIAFSENMNYIFTDKGVTRLSLTENDLNGKNVAAYTYENLNIAIDILKENIEFRFKSGRISLLEYSSHPRRFLYQLMEIFKPKDSISIIKEWEQSFGDNLILINESTSKLLIEEKINDSWDSFKFLLEQWYNPSEWGGYIKKGYENVRDYAKEKEQQAGNWVKNQKKQIQDKGVLGWAKDKASSVWNYVKDGIGKAWKCVTSGAECIMEGLRSLANSALGTAAMTGISMIPVVGQVSNAIVYGSLIIWDIYKMMSGKYESGKYQWSWLDILINAASLLLPIAGKAIKTAGIGLRTTKDIANAAAKGGIIGKAVNAVSKGINTIIGYIGKAAKWLGEKLGLTSLANWGSKASSKISKLAQEVGPSTNKVNALTKVSKVSKSSITKALQGKKNELMKVWKSSGPITMPPRQKLLTSMKKSFGFTVLMCSALGLDGAKCEERARKKGSGFNESELKAMETALADLQLQSL